MRRKFCNKVRATVQLILRLLKKGCIAIGSKAHRYLKYLMTKQAHRDTIKHLNRLSDRELNDIGLTRGDISPMVWLDEDILASGRGRDK